MTGIFVKMIAMSALAAGLAFAPAASRAADIATPTDGIVASDADAPPIILAYGGCGPYAHRGPFGGCRPGGQWGGYVPGTACPRGWHLGPYGQRCWPNGGY